ncbi:hypothetical protein F5H01DRAFT_384488, partial [Linnemannia elongata]
CVVCGEVASGSLTGYIIDSQIQKKGQDSCTFPVDPASSTVIIVLFICGVASRCVVRVLKNRDSEVRERKACFGKSAFIIRACASSIFFSALS